MLGGMEEVTEAVPLEAHRRWLEASSGYRRAALTVLKQYERASETPRGVWPEGRGQWERLVAWMASDLSPQVANASWRLYRRAIQAVCPYQEVTQALWQVNRKGIEHPKRNAAKRRKAITGEEMAKLSHWLAHEAPTWGPLCALWLEAGVMTGLRPTEWQGATLQRINGSYVLRVHNAKQGAGNRQLVLDMDGVEAGYRHVPLSHLTFEEIAVIRNQIQVVEQVREWGVWSKYYEGCRQVLYRANRAVFAGRGTTITLYSARHQYATGLKEGAMSEPLGGLLMGQRTGVTFGRRYGNGRTKGIKALPAAQHEALETFLRDLQEKEDS